MKIGIDITPSEQIPACFGIDYQVLVDDFFKKVDSSALKPYQKAWAITQAVFLKPAVYIQNPFEEFNKEASREAQEMYPDDYVRMTMVGMEADQRHRVVHMEGYLEELFWEMEEEGLEEVEIFNYKDYTKKIPVQTAIQCIYNWMVKNQTNSFTYDW